VFVCVRACVIINFDINNACWRVEVWVAPLGQVGFVKGESTRVRDFPVASVFA
jgi:hypothetical protein